MIRNTQSLQILLLMFFWGCFGLYPAPVSADEVYSILGKAGVGADAAWSRGGASAVSQYAFFDAVHRLSDEKAELYARTYLRQSPEDSAEITLPEAYFRFFPAEELSLSFGRIRYSWGNGLFSSILDVLQPANDSASLELLSSADRPQGFQGAGFQIYPTANLSFTGGVSIDDAIHNDSLSSRGTRYAGLFWLISGKLETYASFTAQEDRYFRPGIGASFDVLGVVLRSEYAVETEMSEEFLHLFSAGMQKSADIGALELTVYTEYMRPEDERNYANAALVLSLPDFWELSGMASVDTQGPSAFFTLSLSIFPGDQTEIGLSYSQSAGKADTVFGAAPLPCGLNFSGTLHF